MLSQHDRLHTLRIRNLPAIDYGWDNANPTTFNLKPISNMEFKLCRVTMQNLANQVLKYTVGKGSPIKLFAAQPSCVLVSNNRLDADVNSY